MAKALTQIGLPGQSLRNRVNLQYLTSPGGHIGQEKWHIAMENEMLSFIRRRGKSLTEKELLEKLHDYYQKPEIAGRIPGVNLGS
ncbi:MAG: hypothetical protein R3C53_00885 [Pirellulaceae bacterium]